jgi:glyoxylase I family protein
LKLGFTMVLTPDLVEAERFYGDVLGLELTDKTPNQLVFELEGTELYVFRCDHAAPDHRHAESAATICVFEVPSIDVAMRRMKDDGVVFLHQTPAVNAHNGIRYAAFRAPGGNVHEIMERHRAIQAP